MYWNVQVTSHGPISPTFQLSITNYSHHDQRRLINLQTSYALKQHFQGKL